MKMLNNQTRNKRNGQSEPENSKKPPISVDPAGSYTGRPVDPFETPVQDADDL